MASDNRRVQFSLRLRPEDKDAFAAATEKCGIDPSVAARQILELVVQRVAFGGDFLDALHELKSAWGVPRKSELELRLEALNRALANFTPSNDHAALVHKIEAVERELAQQSSQSDTRAKKA